MKRYHVTVEVDGSVHGFRVTAESKAQAEEIAENRAAKRFPNWTEIFSVATEQETASEAAGHAKRNPRKKKRIGVWEAPRSKSGKFVSRTSSQRVRRGISQATMLRKPRKNPRLKFARELHPRMVFVEIGSANEWTRLPGAIDNAINRAKAMRIAKRIALVGKKSYIKARVIIK